MTYESLWISNDADPGCHQGSPTHTTQALFNPQDDVSQDGGWACDGCSITDAGHYDIARLEMYDETDPKIYDLFGITTSHVGYLTAYQHSDGTYELVSTLKLGEAFIHQGTCTRAPPDAHDFSCENPIAVSGGKHVLTCVSLLSPGLGTILR